MNQHRIESFLIQENLLLDILFESATFYNGDNIRLVLRLKHLGTKNKLDLLKDEYANITNEINELKKQDSKGQFIDIDDNNDIKMTEGGEKEKSSFNSDSFSLSSFITSRFKDSNKLEENWKTLITKKRDIGMKLKYHQPLNLFSCNCSLTGFFKYDKELLNSSKFDEISILPDSFMQTESADSLYGSIPLFLIPQSLIFTEYNLEPEQILTYKIKSPKKLPTDLPPTYQQNGTFNIEYNFNFDVMIQHNNCLPEKFNYSVPIVIYPFLDKQGRQPVSKLDNKMVIFEPFTVRRIDDLSDYSNTLRSRRRSSLGSIDLTTGKTPDGTRRNSLLLSNNGASFNEDLMNLKNKFKALAEQLEIGEQSNEDVLVSELFEYQKNDFFLKHRHKPLNDMANESVRGNIRYIFENNSIIESFNSASSIFKKEFIINRNAVPLIKIRLNKICFSTTDDIDVTLTFLDNPNFKPTSVLSTLESFEILNPNFALSPPNDQETPNGFTCFEIHSILFDQSDSLSLKIIPYASTVSNLIAPQFKTNFFQLKYMLKFKIVLVNKDTKLLQPLIDSDDRNGTILSCLKNLEGQEFSFYIPILILPSY
ncbi:Rgp1p SCDLUD_001739 [Saccharomycodes ludwigii]|uniref:Rgp1p n=1 Tax=Saccharomycodes ludwigii TaxID=36035 RepID=UPI001E8821A1|nr:hypothetical protein SCDLUD_001739 [Saccharomycodes ludwigii]KAH3901953.1 hypothetical protein SCDLUD_001739 [Saccharomycodes ludwigii]